jgi:hypothetical protein
MPSMATPSFHNPKSSETKISNSKIIRFYLLPGALDSTLWMIKNKTQKISELLQQKNQVRIERL